MQSFSSCAFLEIIINSTIKKFLHDSDASNEMFYKVLKKDEQRGAKGFFLMFIREERFMFWSGLL